MRTRAILRYASLALVALVACGRVDRARVYPGALTRPIDAYSADDLYELTQRLEFTGIHERERRCRGVAGCEGVSPERRALVQVSAVTGQDSLNAGDLPEFGAVQARAINRGQAVEAGYGFQPGDSMRYYLIVQRDSAGGMRWRLEELDTKPPRRHVQIGAGRLLGCGHPWTPGARADFRTCDQPPASDAGVAAPTTFRTALDAPLWVQCNAGCCVAVAQ